MTDNQSKQQAVRDGNAAVPAEKMMSITAKCGTRLKTVVFPIPAGFEEWMCEMRDTDKIEAEGGNSVRIHLEIFTYREKL